MQMVTIKFFAALRDITGRREERLTLAENEPTILKVLNQLSAKHGKEFREYVFGSRNQSQPREQMSIMVNGQSIRSLDNLKTKIKDGDVIAILPPISGG